MKIRVTLMTENDKHMDASNDKLQEITKAAWDMLLAMVSADDETGYVESVEIVER